MTDFRPAAHQTSYFEPFYDVVRRIVLPALREKVVPHRDCDKFFSKEVAQKQATPSPRQDLLTARNRF